MDWQPIETVPKDGTRVLLHLPSGYVVLGEWQENRHYRNGKLVHESAEWNWGASVVWLFDAPEPTHWMPLPASPEGFASQPASFSEQMADLIDREIEQSTSSVHQAIEEILGRSPSREERC